MTDHCDACGATIDPEGTFQVTVLGDGIELSGFIDGLDRVKDFAAKIAPLAVIASPKHDHDDEEPLEDQPRLEREFLKGFEEGRPIDG